MLRFQTEIVAIDPMKPEEGTKTWQGPIVEAVSIEQARNGLALTEGYLRVVGEYKEPRVMWEPEPLLTATEPEPVVEQVSLEVGDVVCLRSGSPSMTINEIDGPHAEVVYFVGQELLSIRLAVAGLMLMHR